MAITVDRNGIVWFTESNASKLARFDPTNHTFAEYAVPGVGDMWGVTVDGRGYVWFTQYSGRGSVRPGGAIVPGGHGRLIRFDPVNKNFSFVDIPTVGSFPFRLIVDRRDRIWFTELLGNRTGVFDQSSNRLEEYRVSMNLTGPYDLTFDQQGTLWFTEAFAQKVVRFYLENQSFSEHSFGSEVFSPAGLAVDKDGHVWVASHGGNWIAEFDPKTQKLIRYPTHTLPMDLTIPNGLLIDPAGRIWFSEHVGNAIAYYDPKTGTMVEFLIPTGPISTALWLALAPNGDVWFTEWSMNKIGVVHANLPVPLSVRVSELHLRLEPGEQTSVSILTETPQDIEGNGTFRYSWSSYDPNEVSVTFMPQYPTLSSDLAGRADIKLSAKVRPANYTLGLGIDAGTVLVWAMIQTEVLQSGPTSTPPFEPLTVYVIAVILLLAALGTLLLHLRSRRNRSAG